MVDIPTAFFDDRKRLIKRKLNLEKALSSELDTPERQTYSVVLLGEFNPAIFQPLWFSNNNLVPVEEAEAAEVAVIHNDITAFSIGKLQIQAQKNRFSVTTADSSQGPIVRDVALGAINILEHTPLVAIGLNLDMTFAFDSEESYNQFGHRLAPKADWEPFVKTPGLRTLIIEGKRPDDISDRLQFRIAPNTEEVPFGVLVAVNQHYAILTDSRADVRQRHDEAVRILDVDWQPFCVYARSSARSLLKVNASNYEAEEA